MAAAAAAADCSRPAGVAAASGVVVMDPSASPSLGKAHQQQRGPGGGGGVGGRQHDRPLPPKRRCITCGSFIRGLLVCVLAGRFVLYGGKTAPSSGFQPAASRMADNNNNGPHALTGDSIISTDDRTATAAAAATTTTSAPTTSITAVVVSRDVGGREKRRSRRERQCSAAWSTRSRSDDAGQQQQQQQQLPPPLIKAGPVIVPPSRDGEATGGGDGETVTAAGAGVTGVIIAPPGDRRSYAYYDYQKMYRDAAEVGATDLSLPNAAPCLLVYRERNHQLLGHFPHAMQQLYQCFDFWIEHPTVTPVLLYNASTSQKEFVKEPHGDWHTKSPFMQGVMELLKSQLGMHIMSIQEYQSETPAEAADLAAPTGGNTTRRYFHPNQTVQTHQWSVGYLVRHPNEWNRLVALERAARAAAAAADTVAAATANATTEQQPSPTNNNNKRNNNNNNNNEATSAETLAAGRKCELGPRITILNREESRRLLNANDLVERLWNMSSSTWTTGGNATTTTTTTTRRLFTERPTVRYFEGRTFDEQVNVFQSTDILVSPHGAQLTGLVFMAAGSNNSSSSSRECGQVMEIFPDRYAIPYFFGSLAVQSGLSHSYMYLGRDEQNKSDVVGITANASAASAETNQTSGLSVASLFESPLASSSRTTTTIPAIVMPWQNVAGETMEKRFQARSAMLCPSLDAMAGAVLELVHDWHRCCITSTSTSTKKEQPRRRRQRRKGA